MDVLPPLAAALVRCVHIDGGYQLMQRVSVKGGDGNILLRLPDEPVITGTSAEVFEYYGLTGQGIARRVQELLRQL